MSRAGKLRYKTLKLETSKLWNFETLWSLWGRAGDEVGGEGGGGGGGCHFARGNCWRKGKMCFLQNLDADDGCPRLFLSKWACTIFSSMQHTPIHLSVHNIHNAHNAHDAKGQVRPFKTYLKVKFWPFRLDKQVGEEGLIFHFPLSCQNIDLCGLLNMDFGLWLLAYWSEKVKKEIDRNRSQEHKDHHCHDLHPHDHHHNLNRSTRKATGTQEHKDHHSHHHHHHNHDHQS